jgi:hypothetical protein
LALKDRKVIEGEIRRLSTQLRDDLTFQLREGISTRINKIVLNNILDKWFELASYYEDNLYDSTTEQEPDLEMSLFIVECYTDLTDLLDIHIGSNYKQGEEFEAETLEVALDKLKEEMGKILQAASHKDEFTK